MSQSGSYLTALVWETSDSEGPTRSEYQTNWNAVDGHKHDNRGAGQGIYAIQTSSVPTQTGDIQITGDTLQWWGATSSAVVSAITSKSTPTSITFAGPAGVANSRFCGILSASGAPTTGSWDLYDFGYDETGVAWLCTVAGSPGTWARVGPALPVTVANGGTGLSTITSHAVMVGNGTGNVAAVGPGTSNYPLVSGGSGADPSFAQLTGAGIASATVTGSNIASGTITSTNIADGAISGAKINTSAATGANIYAALVSDGESSGSTFRSNMHTAYNNATAGDAQNAVKNICLSIFGYDPSTAP